MKESVRGLEGHRAPREKLQSSLDTAHDLGHDPSAEGTQLSPERIKLIRAFPGSRLSHGFTYVGARLPAADRGLPSFLQWLPIFGGFYIPSPTMVHLR